MSPVISNALQAFILITCILSSLLVSGDTTTKRRVGFVIYMIAQPAWMVVAYDAHQPLFIAEAAWLMLMAWKGIRNNPL